MVYKVVVDRAACCGYAVCAEICGAIYKLDGSGLVYVDDEIVSENLIEAAREGADACPQAAISIVEV